jgi:hypothetical protein
VFLEFGLTSGSVIVLLVRLGMVAFSAPGAVAIFGRFKSGKAADKACAQNP